MAGATTSLRMGAVAEPALVAPEGVVETSTGVVVDPSKVKPVVPAGDRPAWLPEKFKTPEDLVASYTELEKKQGTKPVEPPAVTPEAAKAKGVDLDALSREFSTKGELSAESLKALEDKGFTKAQVDQYIAGQQAVAQQQLSKLSEAAGGKEQLTNVLKWAEVNLPKPEQDAYNTLLDAGNIDGAALLLGSIVSKYTEATGSEPRLVNGTPVPSIAGVKPFRSSAEVVTAMNDRRYKTDPAYREDIERRLSISEF